MNNKNDKFSKLSSAQRAQLMERLLKEKHSTQDSFTLKLQVDPQNRYQPFPLTALQQAYWIGRSNAFELGNIASRAYVELQCDNFDINKFSNFE